MSDLGQCQAEVQHGGGWSWFTRCERKAKQLVDDRGRAVRVCRQHANAILRGSVVVINLDDGPNFRPLPGENPGNSEKDEMQSSDVRS